MVSLKENAGTVITRDKRRDAGSLTRICPSNHGKHEPLWRAGKEARRGMKTFARRLPVPQPEPTHLSKEAQMLPLLCHHACNSLFTKITVVLDTLKLCFFLLSIVQRASSQPLCCLSQPLPNRPEIRRDFGSCFLYGTSCARKDRLAATWEHCLPGKKKAHAKLAVCKCFPSSFVQL